MALKKGNFGHDEMEYMITNSHLPAEKVGAGLNRSADAVKKFWISKGLFIEKSIQDKQADNKMLAVLHSLAYWPSIVSSFNDEEMNYYEQNWIAFIKQLNEDVSYSEQLYIKDWLILEIEKKRLLAREKESMRSIEELKAKVIKLYQQDMTDPSIIMQIGNMNTELAAKEAVISQSITALQKLNSDIKYISEKLKTDRSNRREKETSADTYWGYVAKLEEEIFRADESFRAEVYKASMKKAKQELYEYTPFVDQTLDRCILNEFSVALSDEENEQK